MHVDEKCGTNTVAWLGVVALMMANASLAQGFPTKPLRLIVSFVPGGPTDIVARVVSGKMAESLGQPIIVENRGGAGGTIGADAAAKSPGDGYTLLLGTVSTLGLAPSVYPNLPYEPMKAFAPVSLLTHAYIVIGANNTAVPGTLKELIAQAKAAPEKFNYASNGAGNITHVAGELFNNLAGTKLTHIPYKGSAPAAVDVAAGRAHIQFDVLTAFQQHIAAGNLKALAVAGPKRDPRLPNVPTTAEAGMPGFVLSAWFGLVTTAGSPQPVIRRLNAEVQKSLAAADVRDSILKLGLEPAGGSPEQFAAQIAYENDRWPAIVRAAGIKLE
ncbi:MAG: Bug family tripartite tricarboxylate transporter substrate binding protein [Burkholderiales bacterium]